jgi:hypothetical protein
MIDVKLAKEEETIWISAWVNERMQELAGS